MSDKRRARKHRRRDRQNRKSSGGITTHTNPHGRTGSTHVKKIASRRKERSA